MSILKHILSAAIILQAAFATIIIVPTDQATIQGAITAANEFDSVVVQAGTYTENIDFGGKDLVIMSVSGPELTIIDGNQNGSVVLFITNETDMAVLDGFTITNGIGWDGPTYTPHMGGGILIRNGATPVLKNLIVENNTADGAGISPPATGSLGGGILISRNSNPLLRNIVIRNNHSYMGGGLAVYQSDPILENIIISDNIATNSGAGIYVDSGSPYFCHTLVSDNSSTNYGGGVWVHHARPIFNCSSIVFNIAGYQGNSFVLSDSASPVIANSIIWGPASNPNDVFSYTEAGFDPNIITFLYSDYQLGANGVQGLSVTVNWLEGNLSTDPLFTFPSTIYDYSLQAASPCIDAGINNYVLHGETIVDLAPGDYNGNAPDMGAFESQYTVSINDEPVYPNSFILHQNYPNPFNPVTNIRYELPQRSDVQITIYDLIGRKVTTLLSETQDAGFKSVQWGATNKQGQPVSAGVYLLQIKAGEYIQTNRMILLK